MLKVAYLDYIYIFNALNLFALKCAESFAKAMGLATKIHAHTFLLNATFSADLSATLIEEHTFYLYVYLRGHAFSYGHDRLTPPYEGEFNWITPSCSL